MSKKILFIGPLHESSGWGFASRNYVKSLLSVKADLVCRSIKFQNNYKPSEDIEEVLNRKVSNCDICIQHVLPHMFEYNGSFEKNIGLFVTETSNIKYTSWPARLDIMDECWVPNQKMINDIQPLTKTKIRKVNHACDISIYNKNLQPLSIPEIEGTYKFYFIGEYSRRKNLLSAIKAFHTAFQSNENVSLVLKLNKPGYNPEELGRLVDNDILKIKNAMSLYKDVSRYKQELLITFNISDNDIARLHKTCDCFVLPSYGEGWCMPAFDAQAFGNYVLSSELDGPSEYLNKNNSYIIESRKENVTATDKMFEDFGTGRELWTSISTRDLSEKMRLMYDNRQLKCNPNFKDFSYENIGRIMMNYISETNNESCK